MEARKSTAFLKLPTRTHALRALVATGMLFALFMAVYSGTNYLTSLRTEKIRIDFGFEHRLPSVSYTHLTLPTTRQRCRSRWGAGD